MCIVRLGPDFLCIGAQRSGTTWLYENLRCHPDFDMPPHKEIHYFNKMERRVISWESVFSIKKRILLKSRVHSNLHSYSFRTLKWDLRYLFGKRNDDWYCKLLTGQYGKLRGDISPAYSTLDERTVKKISMLFPNIKVIFLMRNPISRAWSHAKMDFIKFYKKNIASVSVDEFIAHFESSASLKRTDYTRTLSIWESIIKPEKMFIGFFDDIIRQPYILLKNICNFLGAYSEGISNLPLINTRVNQSIVHKAPTEIHQYLMQKYQSSIILLSQRFGERLVGWLDDTDHLD